jgi:hypothetical protein
MLKCATPSGDAHVVIGLHRDPLTEELGSPVLDSMNHREGGGYKIR